jgi:catechol 2,3-dioxygenase
MAATRTSLTSSTLVDHIERVDLRVRDIGASLAFYRDVVGLEVAERSETRAALRAPDGPVILTLDSEGVTAPAERRATGLFHVAIRLPTRPALGDALARLASAGMGIGAGDHLVSEALYIDDPDGNGVELYRDRPEDQWPEPQGDMIVPMATLPVDLEAVLAEGRGQDAVGQPAAEGTDIGHVHLQVSDVGETTRFYVEVLGLDLIARMGAQAGFFSSNGYHHHVGANTWNSRHGSPAGKEHAGLERVLFAVSGSSELETLQLRLAEYGHQAEERDGELVVADPDQIELRFTAKA